MIIIEDGMPVVYCDCCGEECSNNYETYADMDICLDCIRKNAQENLCNS